MRILEFILREWRVRESAITECLFWVLEGFFLLLSLGGIKERSRGILGVDRII